MKSALHALVVGCLAALAVVGSGGAVFGQVKRITPPIAPPVIKLPAGESPAQLTRMDVRVTVSGLEAETVTTLTFHNPNARQLAGDFEFPLPDEAAVAGYALDVNGRMVDGVLVSKQKARVVLETETRRRVDPGIVEHVRGNVFRTRIFPLPARGERTVRDGKAPDLFSFLDALPYDGGTDLAALDLRKGAAPNASDAAWLLFTDGLYTLGAGLPALGGLPVHLVASDGVRDAGLQRLIAAATGGTIVDLTTVEPAAGARLLAEPPMTLLRVDAPAGSLTDVQYRFTPGSGRATVYARLLRTGEATLVYAVAGRETLRVPVRLQADSARAGRLIARAWAARRVEELSVFPDRNEAAMIALGRRFGLVTPVTSLIVLETAQQYLEHEIEPPASWPEMRQQYLAGLEARKGVQRRQQASKIDRVLGWWRERVAWWERGFQYPKDFTWTAPADQPSRAEAQAARRDAPRQNVAELAAAPPPPRGFVGGVVGGVAMKAAASEAESVAAGIAIKAWSPDKPYLKAIEVAPTAQAYAAYLEQRRSYADSPSFYLDCAGALLPIDKALGLRVLSNLAELRIDDAALLRVFAWRLGEAGELDRAIETLERVRGLRPEDPQSHRDLALVLADRMDRDRKTADGVRAARLLYDVVGGEWQRFEEIEVIALMELNRLLARLERLDASSASRATFVDERLRKLLDVDVRIVMSWDADNTDIDLHVVEPSGEEAFYGHNTTTIGGHVSRDFTQGYGPEEYVLRRALPGVYKIRCKYYGSSQQTLVGPATVTATVITNYGRADEKRQVLTLRLESVKETVDIGEVTIGRGSATQAKPAARVMRAAVEALSRGAERELSLQSPR